MLHWRWVLLALMAGFMDGWVIGRDCMADEYAVKVSNGPKRCVETVRMYSLGEVADWYTPFAQCESDQELHLYEEHAMFAVVICRCRGANAGR